MWRGNDYQLNKYLKVKHYFFWEITESFECMNEMLCKRGEVAVLEIQSNLKMCIFFILKFKISSVCLPYEVPRWNERIPWYLFYGLLQRHTIFQVRHHE